ncbi:MAG: ABC transporter ATP-binding protein [Deltaproteobacteria bacterium]|nr:ABC transporter ATP-binding protein [Deltaproteobacteria bacterium]
MRADFGYFEEKKLGKPYDVKLLKRLYPFILPYKILFAGSILLVVFITLLDLSLPYITKIAIDRYIVPQTRPDKLKNRNSAKRKTGHKTRFLRVDISDPKIKTVVNNYPDLFKSDLLGPDLLEKDGDFAYIPFDKLSRLNKKELTVLRKEDLSGITGITSIFLAIIIINFALNFIRIMIMEFAGQRIMHDLRMRLFTHIQSLSIAFFNRNPVGRLVTRVTNDIQNMHELFTSVIAFVFKDLFLLIGISLVLLSINRQLALVSFIVLPFVLYASVHFSVRARDAFRTLRIKIAQINTRIAETIEGIKVIQLFLHEKKNYHNFAGLNHENYLAGMQQVRVFAVFMPVIELLGAIALAVIIYYGGSKVIAENISLGSLVAFIAYMKMFFRPIRDIAEKYNIMQNAMASTERIFQILDNRESIPQPVVSPGSLRTVGSSLYKPEASPFSLDKIHEIALENVSFSYVTDETVLKGVSLKLIAGETIAIIGRTGSGKTTLINLLARFYDPVSGRITINGIDIKNYPTSVIRSKMALVMQNPFLFSGTIRDNISQGKMDISEKIMDQVLEASNCKTLINRLPEGLDTILSESGASVSSGERQLISIARAFASNPDLIILDEATSYIDSETESRIRRTSIIVAHRLSTVRHADRIIVLHKGKIIETGSHDELMRKKGFYFRLNQIQL